MAHSYEEEDGKYEDENEISSDSMAVDFTQGYKGKGREKGGESLGSSKRPFDDNMGIPGELRGENAMQPERANGIESGISDRPESLCHVDDSENAQEGTSAEPLSLPESSPVGNCDNGNKEDVDHCEDVTFGMEVSIAKKKRPTRSAGSYLDDAEVNRANVDMSDNCTLEKNVGSNEVSVEDDGVEANAATSNDERRSQSPSRERSNASKTKRKRRRSRRRAFIDNSSDEYSDSDTRKETFALDSEWSLPRRRPRSTRNASLHSSSNTERPPPPPTTLEQPLVIDSDDDGDVDPSVGNGGDTQTGANGSLQQQLPAVSAVSSDDGHDAASNRLDSGMVATDFGDGIMGARTRMERKGAMPGIRKVHLAWGTAYLNQGSIRKVPHETRLVYPNKGTPGAVEVTRVDLIRLQETVFLNDTLIDFYLRYLLSKPDSFGESLKHSEVHVFSPLFVQAIANANDRARPDYLRIVKKWTKGLDLFSKKLVFFPINSCLHWSLVVLCNPDRFTATREPKSSRRSPSPPSRTPPPTPASSIPPLIARTSSQDENRGIPDCTAHGQDANDCVAQTALAGGKRRGADDTETVTIETEREPNRDAFELPSKDSGVNSSSDANHRVNVDAAAVFNDCKDVNSHAETKTNDDSSASHSLSVEWPSAEEIRKACVYSEDSCPAGDELRSGEQNYRAGKNGSPARDEGACSSAEDRSGGDDTESEAESFRDGQIVTNTRGSNRHVLSLENFNGYHRRSDSRSDDDHHDDMVDESVGKDGRMDAEQQLQCKGELIGGGRGGRGARGGTAPTAGSSPGQAGAVEDEILSDEFGDVVASRNAGSSVEGPWTTVDHVAVDDTPPHALPGGDGIGDRIESPSAESESWATVRGRHGGSVDERSSVSGGCSQLPHRTPNPASDSNRSSRANRVLTRQRNRRSGTRASVQTDFVSVRVPVCSLQGLPPSRSGPAKRPIHETLSLTAASCRVAGNTNTGAIDLSTPASGPPLQANGVVESRPARAEPPLKCWIDRSSHEERHSDVGCPPEGCLRQVAEQSRGLAALSGKRRKSKNGGVDRDWYEVVDDSIHAEVAEASESRRRFNALETLDSMDVSPKLPGHALHDCADVDSSHTETTRNRYFVTSSEEKLSALEDAAMAATDEPEPSDHLALPPTPSDQSALPRAPSDQSRTPVGFDDRSETPAPSQNESEMPQTSRDPSEGPAASGTRLQVPTAESDQSEAPASPRDRSETPTSSTDKSEEAAASPSTHQPEALAASAKTPTVTRRYEMRERSSPVYATRGFGGKRGDSGQSTEGVDGPGGNDAVGIEDEEEVPCMLMLDSTKGHRSQEHFKTVRKYLEAAWNTSRLETRGEADVRARTLPGCSPPVPLQTNDCDCGVYVIHYAKLILKNPPKATKEFISKAGRGSIFNKKWFDERAIKQERKHIRNTVETLRWEAMQRERLNSLPATQHSTQ